MHCHMRVAHIVPMGQRCEKHSCLRHVLHSVRTDRQNEASSPHDLVPPTAISAAPAHFRTSCKRWISKDGLLLHVFLTDVYLCKLYFVK